MRWQQCDIIRAFENISPAMYRAEPNLEFVSNLIVALGFSLKAEMRIG